VLFSAHIYDVPQQARKSLNEIKSLRKQWEQSQDEWPPRKPQTLLAETPRVTIASWSSALSPTATSTPQLLAQKLTRHLCRDRLFATESPHRAGLRQSAGQPCMGALLKKQPYGNLGDLCNH